MVPSGDVERGRKAIGGLGEAPPAEGVWGQAAPRGGGLGVAPQRVQIPKPKARVRRGLGLLEAPAGSGAEPQHMIIRQGLGREAAQALEHHPALESRHHERSEWGALLPVVEQGEGRVQDLYRGCENVEKDQTIQIYRSAPLTAPVKIFENTKPRSQKPTPNECNYPLDKAKSG